MNRRIDGNDHHVPSKAYKKWRIDGTITGIMGLSEDNQTSENATSIMCVKLFWRSSAVVASPVKM